MSNLTIFKNPNAVASAALPASALGQQIAATMGGFNRIQTNTNGTFKRIVNGEQVGKAIRGEFNAIIVAMLAKPGREFYGSDYDPDAKATLPDCYSNLGDKPEASSKNRQAANCTTCSNNIDGSGKNGKGKACRFKRKIAILLEGDESGEVYQFNVPAKSLFGKGSGNTHPYEAYCRFLAANGTGPDRVVTTIAYNLDAETMEINFTADRFITPEELEIVQSAQDNPATQRLIQITAGEADGAKPAVKAEEEAPKSAIKPASKVKVKKLSFLDDDEDEEEAEVEAPKAKRTAKKEEPVKASGDLASIVDAWADDEDEED
jgi:hypothetical protein